MSETNETNYYELQEEVQNLRLELMQLKFQQKIGPLKRISNKLNTMQAEFASSVCEVKDAIQDFNKNKTEITQKLQNTKYLNVDENSAVHFKSITQQAFEIVSKPIVTSHEEVGKDDIEHNFIKNVSRNLDKRAESLKCTSRLLTNVGRLIRAENQCLETNENSQDECKVSLNSNCTMNSTINTIITENVAATSSPILSRS